MTAESDFIAALRAIAADPAARGLADDAAVLGVGERTLVLTHDMILEGVHFLASDPPQDVAWKLVAVNLSDLAAKGAVPLGLLLGYSLAGDDAWDQAFLRGLDEAVRTLGAPLLGGDTVAAPRGAPRSFGLTAIGEASSAVPSRAGASDGDDLWVSGWIGDGGAGLCVAIGEIEGSASLLQRYRRPQPRLGFGQALAPLVTAMMDVSDGLLIDAGRMADASGLALEVELGDVPLSDDLIAALGDSRQTRIDASIAGDDYELLFAAPASREAAIRAAAASARLPLTRIGRFSRGSELRILWRGEPMPLPPRLGYEHLG